ncbi:hypothetical protein [Novosphingobium huizhouense]|uniref:hypothetical protein n=1 Tax=Novosphingobium huizhouense TaxID=2866625 RepID=UPI001CD82FF6|nr:hypothetical protein [Novosphingobium huizhouense]
MSRSHTNARATRAPLTAHPLFPVLVALWLAALLGLGSFAVPSALIERVLAAAHVPSLLPAAAPPLGLTARLLIAVGMAGLGVLAGVAIALRLRPRDVAPAPRRRTAAAARRAFEDEAEAALVADEEPVAVRAFDAHPDAPPRKPFDLSEALALDAARDTAAELPSADLAGPEAEAAHDDDAWSEAEWCEAEWSEVDPDDLADEPVVALHPREDAEDEIRAATPVQAEPHDAGERPAQIAAEVAAEVEGSTNKPPIFAMPPLGARAGRAVLAGEPLESMGIVQLVERLALAIETSRRTRASTTGGEGAPVPPRGVSAAEPEAAMAAPADRLQVFVPVPVDAAEAAHIAVVHGVGAPGADLPAGGLPQTFVATIDASDEDVLQSDAAEPDIAELEPAPLRPMPRLFGASDGGSMRSPLRALSPRWRSAVAEDEGELDEEEDVVVPRFLGSVRPDGARVEAAEPAERMAASSLQAPVRQEFIPASASPVAADIAPVVVLPGQHGPRAVEAEHEMLPEADGPAGDPASAEETERALKAALATLQRMTARA